jgi:hypothetical protein
MHNDVQLLPSKEASVARAVISDPKRRAAFEPLYDIDLQTGASIEVFYADPALANSFGRGTGWFWWTCQRGSLPDGPPHHLTQVLIVSLLFMFKNFGPR